MVHWTGMANTTYDATTNMTRITSGFNIRTYSGLAGEGEGRVPVADSEVPQEVQKPAPWAISFPQFGQKGNGSPGSWP
jgi:hypothetical protein